MHTALSIAGSDSGGCAGVQADLKTFTVFGVFGTAVITAVTAQNTLGVKGVQDLPVEFVELQIEAVLSDIGADAIKLGMLSNERIVHAVAKKLSEHGVRKVVVDPVMVATSGDALLSEGSVKTLVREILPMALIVTPNLREAEVLSAQMVSSIDEMKGAARKIKSLGPEYVLIKGGHLDNPDESIDILFDGSEFTEFKAQRIDTQNTHGGGCTYSAAICAGLAKGMTVEESVNEAKEYITGAISNSFDLGAGHGPLNHFWRMNKN